MPENTKNTSCHLKIFQRDGFTAPVSLKSCRARPSVSQSCDTAHRALSAAPVAHSFVRNTNREAAQSTHRFLRHPPLAVSDAVVPNQRVPQFRGQGRGIGQGIHLLPSCAKMPYHTDTQQNKAGSQGCQQLRGSSKPERKTRKTPPRAHTHISQPGSSGSERLPGAQTEDEGLRPRASSRHPSPSRYPPGTRDSRAALTTAPPPRFPGHPTARDADSQSERDGRAGAANGNAVCTTRGRGGHRPLASRDLETCRSRDVIRRGGATARIGNGGGGVREGGELGSAPGICGHIAVPSSWDGARADLCRYVWQCHFVLIVESHTIS